MRLSIALFLGILISANAQAPKRDELGQGLPDLKASQVEQLLKDDKKKSVADAAEILDLATALKEDLEKNDQHVLSVATLKKAEEIEKLAKRIRSRMRRF